MSHRIEKLNKAFLHELSTIINQHFEFDEALVTVTGVELAVDLTQAKVFISVLPFEKTSGVLAQIINQRQLIKKILNQSIKIRKLPNLIFLVDNTEEQASHIEKIINQI